MKYEKIFEGEYVYFSKMSLEDVDTYVKWINDENITRYTLGGKITMTREGELEWLKANRDNEIFAIIDKKTNKLIGNCGYNVINEMHGVGTLGIFIGDDENRDRGLGTDTVRAVVKYGFETLNLHVIRLYVYSFNERAIKCYKKVGFKEQGRTREACFIDGKRYDEIIMDILKEEVM